MPVYRNRKTGVEFSSNCECQGVDIERLPEAPAAQPDSPAPAKKATRKAVKK